MIVSFSLDGKTWLSPLLKDIQCKGDMLVVNTFGNLYFLQIGKPIHLKLSFDGVDYSHKYNALLKHKVYNLTDNVSSLIIDYK